MGVRNIQKSMIKVFISSTFRDLRDERRELLEALNSAIHGIGMENFTPDGSTGHEKCLEELKDCQVVIFMITPEYGSLIESCALQCDIDRCPMQDGVGKIAYTHCEYKRTIADDMPHMTYVSADGWNELVVDPDKADKEIELSIRRARKGLQFKRKISETEFFSRNTKVEVITAQLVKKMLEWYGKDLIEFRGFRGRKEELANLYQSIEGGVEVHGVGGSGKTTLVHVALLLKKLVGYKIKTVGVRQSYSTDSGYEYFWDKCKDDFYIVDRERIGIDDVIIALGVEDSVRSLDAKNKINWIADYNRKSDIILFIDDFHHADKDVEELVKISTNIVIASRSYSHITRGSIPLIGIREEEREELIDVIAERVQVQIDPAIKNRISDLAEGLPITTELLVKNSQSIDFSALADIKTGLDFSIEVHVEDFRKRVVEEILSRTENAYWLLEQLSVINTDVEGNLDRDVIEEAYEVENISEAFFALIRSDMIKLEEGKYRFSLMHIKDIVQRDGTGIHERAINYYEKKIDRYGAKIEDEVELLWHNVKVDCLKIISRFLRCVAKISPSQKGFVRLVEVGEELRKCLDEEEGAPIVGTLGNIYQELKRFSDSERSYNEALELYRELAEKNPETYNPDVAMTLNNLGNLYSDTGKPREAEEAYDEALGIRRELAEKNPETYNPDLAAILNNLGNLYSDTERPREAEEAYDEALELYRELAEKNPEKN